jgi:antirestriction protein ArdC
MTTSSSDRIDVYGAITAQIIAAIDAGADHPQMPWHSAGGIIERPINVASGKGYRGVNTVALWASAYCQHFPTGLWGTYRQWQAKGAQVRKGEKSSLIVFYKDMTPTETEASASDGDEGSARRNMARASRVFNVAQVDGYASPVVDVASNPIAPCERAEQLVAVSGAKIVLGGISAHYDRRADHIAMPDRFRFIGTKTSTASESWYSTMLHELTHWSGAKHRLARTFGERFGDDAYAMEEMVAELGAAFLCGDLGITVTPRPDHADYIGHWLRILKGDRKAIFTAASAANKAAEFPLNFDRQEVREAA